MKEHTSTSISLMASLKHSFTLPLSANDSGEIIPCTPTHCTTYTLSPRQDVTRAVHHDDAGRYGNAPRYMFEGKRRGGGHHGGVTGHHHDHRAVLQRERNGRRSLMVPVVADGDMYGTHPHAGKSYVASLMVTHMPTIVLTVMGTRSLALSLLD